MSYPAQQIRNLFWATVLLLVFAIPVSAQQNSQASRVYLKFQYHGIIDTYIPTYYKDNQFYLPVSNLFDKLKIYHQINQRNQTISGTFPDENEYLFNFREHFVQQGDTKIDLQPDDYLIKEIDYFVKPEILKKIFALNLIPEFNSLTLDLESEFKLPVVVRHEQKKKRQRIDRRNPLNKNEHYPLRYDRRYNILDGAFLDYSMVGLYAPESQLFTFNNAAGIELLGGDVTGNFYGSFSEHQKTFTTHGLRWRYVRRNNDYFSSAVIGQTFNEGITSRAITGFKISNKPVEPRLKYDQYTIDGTAPPKSNVELYLNNRLIDFQQADQSGYYHFATPLTYGSNIYSTRVYKPNGQIIEQRKRIHIPFNFVPPGEIDYSLSAGRLQNPILGSTKRGYAGATTVSTGITDWLTGEFSVEYLSDYHSDWPSFTSTLNARIFENYLISANANSKNFYRLTSSVLYSSGASWNLSYEYNPGNSRLYNIGGNDHIGRLSLFLPLNLGPVPLNFRWSTTYQQEQTAKQMRYRANLGTRLGAMNIRFGYQDQQVGTPNFTVTSSSRITNSYSYSFRSGNVPQMLEGLYIDGQLSYLPGFNRMEEVELQLSRDLFSSGRVRFSYGRNFFGGFNFLSLNLSINFDSFRTRTTARANNSSMNISQSIRGSVGLDPEAGQLLFNNRQQVGQASAAVRLFVDRNNDGSYQQDTDDIINEPAVTVKRGDGRTLLKNGVNYVTQLKPYYRYDVKINSNHLGNPLLAPRSEKFSIVTDPNQYKTIDIPFYMSGVVSGKVVQKQDTANQAVSGARVYLQSAYTNSSREPFSKELRTFSDGSFYTYKVPPGKYELYIDSNQLELLDAVSKPDTMNIKLEELAKGDYVENLKFTLISHSDTSARTEKTVLADKTVADDSDSTETLTDKELHYKIQLASFGTLEKAKQVAMEATKRLGGSYSLIKNTSNGLYAIRSNPIPKKKSAVETVISYHNASYKSSALVVLKSVHKQTPTTQTKYVQIGAFSTKRRAERFAHRSARELNRETAITYNSKSDLYKVYVNEVLATTEERNNMLASVKNKFSFRNAFINDSGYIQLGAFADRRNAETFADLLKMSNTYSIEIAKDNKNGLFDVYISREYGSQKEKRELLEQIRNQRSIFNDAFVSGFSTTDFGIPEHRNMNFSFRIQLNALSEESKANIIAEVKEDFPQVHINRLENGALLFHKLPSWSETVQLHTSLTHLSGESQPIIILVEHSGISN